MNSQYFKYIRHFDIVRTENFYDGVVDGAISFCGIQFDMKMVVAFESRRYDVRLYSMSEDGSGDSTDVRQNEAVIRLFKYSQGVPGVKFSIHWFKGEGLLSGWKEFETEDFFASQSEFDLFVSKWTNWISAEKFFEELEFLCKDEPSATGLNV